MPILETAPYTKAPWPLRAHSGIRTTRPSKAFQRRLVPSLATCFMADR